MRRGTTRWAGAWLALTLALSVIPTGAAGQGPPNLLPLPPLPPLEVHGESATFAGHEVAIVWGVLQRPIEAETEVVIRITPAGNAYTYLSVEAVDPFTQARRPLVSGQPLGELVDVRALRTTFAEWPRRELSFYRTRQQLGAGVADLTVYYLGVPDTAPEFTSEVALQSYLAATTARLRGAASGPTP